MVRIIIADNAVSRRVPAQVGRTLQHPRQQRPRAYGGLLIGCLTVWLAGISLAEAAPPLPGPARRLQVGRPAAPARPYGYFPTQWSRWPWDSPDNVKPSRKTPEQAEAEKQQEEAEQPTPADTEAPGALELPDESEGLPAPPSGEEALPPLELPDAFPPDEPPATLPEGEPSSVPPGDVPGAPDTPPPPPLPPSDGAPPPPPELPPDLAPPSDQTRYHRKTPLVPQLRPAIAGGRSRSAPRPLARIEKARHVTSVWQGFEPGNRRAPTSDRQSATRRVQAKLSDRSGTAAGPVRGRHKLQDAGSQLPGLHDPRQLRPGDAGGGSAGQTLSHVVPTTWNVRSDRSMRSGSTAPRNPLRSSSRLGTRTQTENSAAPRIEPRRALRDNPLR